MRGSTSEIRVNTSFGFHNDTFRTANPLPPKPWINYLGNRRLKAFISQNAGGLLWHHEPHSRRISRYHYTAPPGDRPGFYIYIRDREDGSVWNPHFAPSCAPLDSFICEHRPGRTGFAAERNGIAAAVDYGIPPDHDAMLWRARLTNTSKLVRRIQVVSYLEFGLLEFLREALGWCYLQSHFSLGYDKALEAIRYDYHVFEAPFTPRMLFAGSHPADRYEISRDAFIGRTGTLAAPEALSSGRELSNSELPTGGHGAGVIAYDLELAPGETLERTFFFALGETSEAVAGMADYFRKTRSVEKEFAAIDAFWKDRLGRFSVSGLDEIPTAFINIWNPYNALVAAEQCRIISTDHMGTDGYRYRDTSQDALSIASLDPDYSKSLLLSVLETQATDGSGVFNFFPGTNRPPGLAPLRSDNGVWPVWTAQALIAENGDLSLLDIEVSFRDGPKVPVWDHLRRGLEWIAARRGPHGLPFLQHADWNDGLALFGDEKAESVMLGLQFAAACRDMAEMAALREDQEMTEWADALRSELAATLNSDAVWDGAWYRRLLLSNGKTVGSAKNSQGRIFLEPQVWSVLSGVGDFENRGRIAMDSVAEHLSTEAGLMILAPAFRGFPEPEDPPKGSSAGSNENGAVFCHANTWAIIAEAMLGRADRAWKYYSQLLPPNVISRFGEELYQREPYVYVSSIAGADSPFHGRAGISWLTGTASWMYIAVTQYLLGIRPTVQGLIVNPCLPKTFGKITVNRFYRGQALRIEIDPASGTHTYLS
jgi:cellobiose phosphorylase